MPFHKPYPDPPFIIEHKRLDEQSGHFTPLARIHLTEAARTSGFLRELSGIEARLLLAILTYLTADGELRVSSWQVARALGMPTPVIAVHLFRLTHRRFGGQPLLVRNKAESGLSTYTLSHHHVRHHVHPPVPFKPVSVSAAGREAVYNHVRSQYGVPRIEAEKTVHAQLGLHPEEQSEVRQAHVFRELRYLKLRRGDIESLVEVFGIDILEQQLAWLPERTTRPDARALVKALINEYGRPRRLQDVLNTYLKKKERMQLSSDSDFNNVTKGDSE